MWTHGEIKSKWPPSKPVMVLRYPPPPPFRINIVSELNIMILYISCLTPWSSDHYMDWPPSLITVIPMCTLIISWIWLIKPCDAPLLLPCWLIQDGWPLYPHIPRIYDIIPCWAQCPWCPLQWIQALWYQMDWLISNVCSCLYILVYSQIQVSWSQ